MSLIETAVGLALAICQNVSMAILTTFFPQVVSMESHLREHWRRYVTWTLYALAIGLMLSFVFFICLLVAFVAHGQITRGLNIHYVNLNFDMAMVQGAQWGAGETAFKDHPEFISKKDASSFNSRRSSNSKSKTRRNSHLEDKWLFREDRDSLCEGYYEEDKTTIKKQRKIISELENEVQVQSQVHRCIQRATPDLQLLSDYDYTISIILTTPETHPERLRGNTPLSTKIGDISVTKPIPTPSRSYLLSIFRTLFYAPLLVIDALPETAEIEISIWGGSNRPFNSPDATGSVEFVIESCDIQILNAKIIVTPSISMVQLFISRFRYTSIALIAMILDFIVLIGVCMAGMLYMYVYQQTVKPSERYMDQTEDDAVEDLSSSEEELKRHRTESTTESMASRVTVRSRRTMQKDEDDNVSDSWSECVDSD